MYCLVSYALIIISGERSDNTTDKRYYIYIYIRNPKVSHELHEIFYFFLILYSGFNHSKFGHMVRDDHLPEWWQLDRSCKAYETR
jgi:hypothetical protein